LLNDGALGAKGERLGGKAKDSRVQQRITCQDE
jgi:hypothetical protein